MRRSTFLCWRPVAALAIILLPALARGDDADALALQSAPAESVAPSSSPVRLFLEATVGRATQRHEQPALTASRFSIDANANLKLGSNWRFTVSNRLDQVDPAASKGEYTINSLREVFASWRDETGAATTEFGRINLRNGPAYGYNPTDFFRKDALRTLTTTDPLALRENRLGTVMLRHQRLWPGSALSLAIAPKLADARSTASFSADLGATNRSSRALASWSTKFSDRVGGQWLAYYDDDAGAQLGLNATALMGDKIVGHFELTRGRDWLALSGSTGPNPAALAVRNRLSAGATYTMPTRLSLTAEYEYNGFAARQSAWANAGAAAIAGHLVNALASQETASRSAWMIYASQKNALWTGLDLSALLRWNADDHSRLAWIELRQHWSRFDLALQWQSMSGKTLSEYGLPPGRRALSLLGALYF